MLNSKTIGIIGGMGPEATYLLAKYIIDYTPAEKDQDHIPVITYSNPLIPDRTRGVLGLGEFPGKEIVRTAKVLEGGGADFLLMPCFTAHSFLDYIQDQVGIPIVNMIDVCSEHMSNRGITKVGLLATTGSIASGIFSKSFSKYGIKLVTPSSQMQDNVMKGIYLIKSKGKKEALVRLRISTTSAVTNLSKSVSRIS